MIDALIENLHTIGDDPIANYVLQVGIEVASAAQKARCREKIGPVCAKLRARGLHRVAVKVVTLLAP